MLKPYLIRKEDCGHWVIFKVIDLITASSNELEKAINKYGMLVINYDFVANEIAHLETFSDVLVLLNVGVMGDGKY